MYRKVKQLYTKNDKTSKQLSSLRMKYVVHYANTTGHQEHSFAPISNPIGIFKSLSNI